MPSSIQHLRPPRPLRFAASDPEWFMGQSTRHFKLCVYLWQMLRRAATPAHTVGADNFVYFDGADESRKCAPDAFVKLGVHDHDFPSWKTWELGTPELCIEILSPSETKEFLPLAEKLARYHSMGVREVVCLDVEAPPGARLRAWDRVEGDLVERRIAAERTPCLSLGLWFHVGAVGDQPVALFLATDEAASNRVPLDADVVAAKDARIAELEARLRER